MAVETRQALLRLPASGSAPASVEVEPQPRRRRRLRAAVILATAVVLMPPVFFVPPHFLWPLVVLGAGIYLARRAWSGEYIVRSFDGACPRCGEPLAVEVGTRIRGRQRVECYSCHREPELVLEPPSVRAPQAADG